MPLRNYEYRIYPSRKHRKRLKRQFFLAKKMYNILLLLHMDTYSATGKTMSRTDMNNAIKRLKEFDTDYKEVHSQVLQNMSDRIAKAFKAFFRRVKEWKAGKKVKVGYPRHKRWLKSITYPQSGFRLVTGRRLYISKVGNVHIVLHRPPRGKVRTMTVKWTRTDKWFVVLSCETEDASENDPAMALRPPHPFGHRHIGIDVGLTSFAVDSDGEVIENPRYLVKSEKRLKKLQRRVSKKVKGSKNRRKAKLRLSRLHEKIANQRKDFLHKESRRIADNYGLIGVEDLRISNMLKNHRLAKHISDASWGQFLQMIGYKAESANAQFVAVNPRGTTSECSGCGANVPKELSDRTHECPKCGLVLSRDHNSALVIRKRAEHTVGLTGIHACGDLTTTGRSDRSASRVHETGTTCDKA